MNQIKNKDAFINQIAAGYPKSERNLVLGAAMLDGTAVEGLPVGIPLNTLNRHGLIAGATGTGKTKTLQLMAEGLSKAGVPTLLMDIKGDLSGIAASGTSNAKIESRHQQLGMPWKPEAFPVEIFSISEQEGVRLRSTITEFGPVLFSRILGLNDTQSGAVAMVFEYCDKNHLPLIDLKDFRKVIQFLTNEGKKEVEQEYGRISTASTSTIIRKVLELEQQGAEKFFGERSFEPTDLLRTDAQGRGYVNIIRLTDLQDRPKLFATFMLSLLAEIYSTFPEEGDLEQPKLVVFIDEAHLIFNEAGSTLLNQIETMIKLIRSKGIGVFFCTQQPSDVPDAVLSQLGLKVQHALRAFTAGDRKNIKAVAENYPDSAFYATEELLTSLGIGEALVTALNTKGIPAPLVHVLLCAPVSRMGVLEASELKQVLTVSGLAGAYNQVIDRESAYEILTAKMAGQAAGSDSPASGKKPADKPGEKEKSLLEEFTGSAMGRQVTNTVMREITRGLLGVLGVRATTRRRRNSWF